MQETFIYNRFKEGVKKFFLNQFSIYDDKQDTYFFFFHGDTQDTLYVSIIRIAYYNLLKQLN